MCVTRNGRTRFACGHSEDTSSVTECQNYVEIGECADAEIIWMGSNTSRNRVCSTCQQPEKSDSGKKDEEDTVKEEDDEQLVENEEAEERDNAEGIVEEEEGEGEGNDEGVFEEEEEDEEDIYG